MKLNKSNLILGLALAITTLTPAAALAHGGASMMNSGYSDMMRYVEDKMLNDESHAEMESLMVKMMNGSMSEEEAVKMAELMGRYPGASGMMASRMMGARFADEKNFTHWGGMMGGGGVWTLTAAFTWLVWLGVGVLAFIWLWGKVILKK